MTLEQLSHVKIVPRLRPDFVPLTGLEASEVCDWGGDAERVSSTLLGSSSDVPVVDVARETWMG